jgi:hypothetical protein
MVARILSHYHAARPETVAAGTHWYDSARVLAETFAARYGTTTEVAACVIAAHSMNASWSINVRRAEAQLAGSPAGLGAAISMAAAAIANPTNPFDYIVGAKLNPFARNVAGDEQHVATDRWAQRAGFGTADDKVCGRLVARKGVRDSLIDAYRKAAAEIGVTPAVMQAVVWVHVRGRAD